MCGQPIIRSLSVVGTRHWSTGTGRNFYCCSIKASSAPPGMKSPPRSIPSNCANCGKPIPTSCFPRTVASCGSPASGRTNPKRESPRKRPTVTTYRTTHSTRWPPCSCVLPPVGNCSSQLRLHYGEDSFLTSAIDNQTGHEAEEHRCDHPGAFA